MPVSVKELAGILTLSSIYTRFNKLKKKHFGKHCGKDEIAHNEQFHVFPQFSMQSVS